MKNGFYLENGTFHTVPLKRSGLFTDFATRVRARDFTSFLNIMPNPDEVMRTRADVGNAFYTVRRDPRVSAAIDSRVSGSLKQLWEVVTQDEAQKDFYTSFLKQLDLRRIFMNILDSVQYGYQPLEIMWKYSNGKIVPCDLVAKPFWWFAFTPENHLKFIGEYEKLSGAELPSDKFICPVYKSSFDNPYGIGNLSLCFWPVIFKRGGLKFFLAFIERYGSPWTVGKLPRSAAKKDYEEMLDMLEGLIQDAVAAIPDDSSVEIIEAGGKAGSSEVYTQFLNYMDKEIVLVQQGQTLTTDTQGTGSFALGKVHGDVRDDIIESDCKLIESAMNELFRIVHKLNFTSNDAPTFQLYKEDDVDMQLADRDVKLASTGNVKFTKAYYMKAYGFDDEDLIVDTSTPLSPVTFSEAISGVSFEDAVMGRIPESRIEKQSDELTKSIYNIIQASANYDDFTKKLYALYPDMATTDIENLLKELMITGDIAGRTL